MAVSRLLLALLLLVSTIAVRADGSTIVLNEILIGLKPDVNAEEYFATEWPNASKITPRLTAYQLKIDAPTEAAVLEEVERRKTDPRVEWASPNFLFSNILPPLNPPILLVLGPPPGRYTGTVIVQKSLAAQELSDKYLLRAQARVVDGKITILTSTNQGPGSTSELGSEPAVEIVPTVLQGENNCLVDGRYPGRFTVERYGLKIRYTVSPDEAQSSKVPVTTFEFNFRKR